MKKNTGQALITLLFFIVIAITVISAAVIIIITNAFSANTFEQSTDVYYAAESGIENTLLQLVRNPSYTGETFSVDTATVTTTVTQGTPITILSTAQQGQFIRKIQAQATYTNNVLTISSWKEVY
jgi:hypothetical protein